MKQICPVGAALFHEDRRTDKTKLTITLRNFMNAPKNDGDKANAEVSSDKLTIHWNELK